MHILPNISRSKDNQTMKFSQLIEQDKRSIFSKTMIKMSQVMQLQTSLLFIFKSLNQMKESGFQFSFNIVRQPSTWNTIKTNYIKLQTFDLEICSILTFQERIWKQFLYHILCMTIQEKCLSYYILLTNCPIHCPIAFTS